MPETKFQKKKRELKESNSKHKTKKISSRPARSSRRYMKNQENSNRQLAEALQEIEFQEYSNKQFEVLKEFENDFKTSNFSKNNYMTNDNIQMIYNRNRNNINRNLKFAELTKHGPFIGPEEEKGESEDRTSKPKSKPKPKRIIHL